MARVVSKVVSSNSSGDVLASIRKLVAHEAQQGTPTAPAPVFRSSVRTPVPAAVPFRHTSGARDWLVGAIDEEKRMALGGSRNGSVEPLALTKPLRNASGPHANPPREWKPRISLALVNPVKAPEQQPARDADLAPDQLQEGKASAQRFQPWRQDALSDGFAQLDNARNAGKTRNRLLLTQEFRVPGPGEPANFNTPAPHANPRFTLKPAHAADSDLAESKSGQHATKIGKLATAPQQPAPSAPEKVDASDARALNSELLRDVVADVLREELRGSLGERITRNVRKLVRSEINRAVEAAKLTERDDKKNR